jgi:hypothetical protein
LRITGKKGWSINDINGEPGIEICQGSSKYPFRRIRGMQTRACHTSLAMDLLGIEVGEQM